MSMVENNDYHIYLLALDKNEFVTNIKYLNHINEKNLHQGFKVKSFYDEDFSLYHVYLKKDDNYVLLNKNTYELVTHQDIINKKNDTLNELFFQTINLQNFNKMETSYLIEDFSQLFSMIGTNINNRIASTPFSFENFKTTINDLYSLSSILSVIENHHYYSVYNKILNNLVYDYFYSIYGTDVDTSLKYNQFLNFDENDKLEYLNVNYDKIINSFKYLNKHKIKI